ncbi:GNAT family N-acetyltransferase [Paenibacillus hamazuiensis]|uniref:GNAT family N-acetyltransferase n=1 Tax=Paenibacillus hamazuiensis TaxID=2936508 RepID=UPI00200C7A68|nr:GNAT family N-acetyltransferase [Paenibacillus hamazuiensis]
MITILPASTEDDPFMYALYCDTRSGEVSMFGWAEEQAESFMSMQFELQRQSYKLQYPEAVYHIILNQGEKIGRIITAEREQTIILVDISLLSAYRSRGIGTHLLTSLQQHAGQLGKAIGLHVIFNNPAQRLYRRLGFAVVEEKFPYIAMEWSPSDPPCTI